MNISLDHVTIRTHQLEKTKNFFIQVFGLKEGTRPKLIQRIPGYWLYADNQPLVHLIGTRGISNVFQAEAYDHVGFKLNGYKDFLQKIQDMDIPYSLMDLEEINERRIFFRAPEGQLIETVFSESVN